MVNEGAVASAPDIHDDHIGGPPKNDFNGDGKSDLLWQNNDGTPAVWEMNGTSCAPP